MNAQISRLPPPVQCPENEPIAHTLCAALTHGGTQSLATALTLNFQVLVLPSRGSCCSEDVQI